MNDNPEDRTAAERTSREDVLLDRNVGVRRQSGLKWRCHKCHEIARSWAGAQRHADENRHYRIEVLFSEKGEAA